MLNFNLNSTEVAILLETVNKYTPSVHKFRLQSVTGLQENSLEVQNSPVSKSNIMNENAGALAINSVKWTDVVELTLPKDVARNYPTKYIPPGTRFIVSFTSGDVTKPVIVGRDF